MSRSRQLASTAAIAHLRRAQRQAAELALGHARREAAVLAEELARRDEALALAEAAWSRTVSAASLDLPLATLWFDIVRRRQAAAEGARDDIAMAERAAEPLASALRLADVRRDAAETELRAVRRRIRRRRDDQRLAELEDRLLQRGSRR